MLVILFMLAFSFLAVITACYLNHQKIVIERRKKYDEYLDNRAHAVVRKNDGIKYKLNRRP